MITSTYASMADFSSDEEHFYFNIEGEREEFWTAVESLKESINWKERSWSDEDQLWTVERTEKNERALRDIFINGDHCCDQV